MRLSVIIPTLNEASTISGLLTYLCTIQDPDLEIIVVDGDSIDATVSLASMFPIQLITAPQGRAVQMNTGAQHATGNALFFLHADCKPPRNFPDVIRRQLSIQNISAGSFSYTIDDQNPIYRWIEWWARQKARINRMPYGDHGLFVRKDIFFRAGCFPEIEVCEDIAVVQNLKKMGKIVIVPEKIYASSRCFKQSGIIKSFCIYWTIALLYMAGVSTRRLGRLTTHIRAH